MNQQLINLVLALSTGELLHNVAEAQQVRKKVEWLRLSIAGQKYVDRIPFPIDTRAKSYIISLIGLILPTAFLYAAFTLFNFSADGSLLASAIILVLAYAVTAVLLDKYHVEIAGVTKPFQKKIKSK